MGDDQSCKTVVREPRLRHWRWDDADGAKRPMSSSQQRHTFPCRCCAELFVERGKRQAHVHGKCQIGGVVSGEVVAIARVRIWLPLAPIAVTMSSCSSLCMECQTSIKVSLFRRKQIISTFRISCQKRSGTYALTVSSRIRALSAIGLLSSGRNQTIATEASITKSVSGVRSVSTRRSLLA